LKISVITASLNRKDLIRAAVESVLEQRYAEFEHWIIDGGSSDGTLEVLREYSHLKVICEPDRGVYDAWNKGIRQSTGDIISFLNTDDLYSPEAFRRCVETFQNFPDAAMVSGGCQIFCTTSSGDEIEMHRYGDPRRYQLSLRNVTVGLPIINSRFIRRSLFSQIGGFDLSYSIAADREFLMRAALAGAKDTAVADILYRYRHHPGSLTMNAGNWTMIQGLDDGLKMIERARTDDRLLPGHRLLLQQWERELQATKVLAYAVMGEGRLALATAGQALRKDWCWAPTFLRCGILAMARRIRMRYRVGRRRAVSGVKGSPKKVRVLHLIDSLDLGGAQTVLLAMLQTYDRSKFIVRIASMHGDRKSIYYERARKAKIPLTMLSPRKWLPLYLVSLPMQFLPGRYQVVHCHLFVSNWLGKPLARLFGVPLIVSHDHCNDALRIDFAAARLIDRFANMFSDRIFAVSPSIREFLISFEKIPPAKIRVIPNGVPEDVSDESGAKTGKVIGGAGRLVAQKNFDRFLQIARELQDIDSSYQFIVAGAGPFDGRLRKKATDLEVRIEWLGIQSSLDRFFSRVDLYLLTSNFEGLPMTLLEALQRSVPAAAMAVDGIAENFTDEVLLLDPAARDQEIAEQIHGMLQDSDRLSAQIERGRQLISKRFSARARMLEIEQDYLALLERKLARIAHHPS